MCNLGSGEAVGCGKRRVLTTLVRSPSVAPNRVGVKTERAQDSLRVWIGIERVNHKSEWIHRGIRLCVHCVDGSYSQVTGGPLTRPGETSQRHRGSMSGRRTIAPKTPNACLRNPPIGGWQQTSLYVGEGSHDSEKGGQARGSRGKRQSSPQGPRRRLGDREYKFCHKITEENSTLFERVKSRARWA